MTFQHDAGLAHSGPVTREGGVSIDQVSCDRRRRFYRLSSGCGTDSARRSGARPRQSVHRQARQSRLRREPSAICGGRRLFAGCRRRCSGRRRRCLSPGRARLRATQPRNAAGHKCRLRHWHSQSATGSQGGWRPASRLRGLEQRLRR